MRSAALPLAALATLVACAGEASPAPLDAGRDLCRGPADCDDGVYCNGAEVCMPGVPAADGAGCVSGAPPCAGACDEGARECGSASCDDADGDGAEDAACGGTDCDDTDPGVFPGAVELCDAAGRDEDCDPTTFGARDLDGDGWVDFSCCNGPACGRDCDDTRAGTNPAVPEVCDELDNDCDGSVDEGLLESVFLDQDRDLHGDPDAPLLACPGIPGTSASALDCDDTDPSINAPQAEISDSRDNDCDGRVDEDPQAVIWYPDGDGDAYGDPLGATVFSSTVVPDHSLLGIDCDDGSGAVSPVADELCNGLDDDCDGLADFAVGVNDFEDDDGDGVPDAACAGPGGDCDDGDPNAFPGAEELCGNGRDDDCDDRVDEGCGGPPIVGAGPADFASDCGGGCSVSFDFGSAGPLEGLTRDCGVVPGATFDVPDFDFALNCDAAGEGVVVIHDSVWHEIVDGRCLGRLSLSFAADGRVGVHSCDPDAPGVGAYRYVVERGRRFVYFRFQENGIDNVLLYEIVAGDARTASSVCAGGAEFDGLCMRGEVAFPPFPGSAGVSAAYRGSWLACTGATRDMDDAALAAACDADFDAFSTGSPGNVMRLSAGTRDLYEFLMGRSDDAPFTLRCGLPARSVGDELQVWESAGSVVRVETTTLRRVSVAGETYLVEDGSASGFRAYVDASLGAFTDGCATVPAPDWSVP
ncbi:MAG: putative metal-binding motif-containing protein [Myxococcota bacterium]